MTKRVTLHIVVLLFSFFIFLSQPLADNVNVNVTIPSQYGDIFDTLQYKDYMISSIESLLSSENLDLGFVLFCKNNATVPSCRAITFPESSDSVTNFAWLDGFLFNSAPGTIGTTTRLIMVPVSPAQGTAYFGNLAYWTNYTFYTTGTDNNYYPVYSTKPLYCPSNFCKNNTLFMKYDTYSYEVPVVNEMKAVPTLAELYDVWFASPTPTDDYPLLTQFFTLFIDKITYVSEYFVSNYVYLYMFTLFIFLSFILLLKRRLF